MATLTEIYDAIGKDGAVYYTGPNHRELITRRDGKVYGLITDESGTITQERLREADDDTLHLGEIRSAGRRVPVEGEEYVLRLDVESHSPESTGFHLFYYTADGDRVDFEFVADPGLALDGIPFDPAEDAGLTLNPKFGGEKNKATFLAAVREAFKDEIAELNPEKEAGVTEMADTITREQILARIAQPNEVVQIAGHLYTRDDSKHLYEFSLNEAGVITGANPRDDEAIRNTPFGNEVTIASAQNVGRAVLIKAGEGEAQSGAKHAILKFSPNPDQRGAVVFYNISEGGAITRPTLATIAPSKDVTVAPASRLYEAAGVDGAEMKAVIEKAFAKEIAALGVAKEVGVEDMADKITREQILAEIKQPNDVVQVGEHLYTKDAKNALFECVLDSNGLVAVGGLRTAEDIAATEYGEGVTIATAASAGKVLRLGANPDGSAKSAIFQFIPGDNGAARIDYMYTGNAAGAGGRAFVAAGTLCSVTAGELGNYSDHFCQSTETSPESLEKAVREYFAEELKATLAAVEASPATEAGVQYGQMYQLTPEVFAACRAFGDMPLPEELMNGGVTFMPGEDGMVTVTFYAQDQLNAEAPEPYQGYDNPWNVEREGLVQRLEGVELSPVGEGKQVEEAVKELATMEEVAQDQPKEGELDKKKMFIGAAGALTLVGVAYTAFSKLLGGGEGRDNRGAGVIGTVLTGLAAYMGLSYAGNRQGQGAEGQEHGENVQQANTLNVLKDLFINGIENIKALLAKTPPEQVKG